MELLYRLGGATAPQLAELLGISDAAASRTLKGLERSRLCEQNAVKAWWHPSNGRPRSFYYLSSRDGGRGVTYGAYLAGEEDARKARASYKLTQLPARAAHASLRNEYYLLLLHDVEARTEEADEEDMTVPQVDMWSESHPDFPFYDEGTVKSDRKNARTKYGRVYPDGYFTARFGSGGERLACRYLLEVETQSRARKLLGKMDGYGSYFARRYEEDPSRMSEWLSPVVFVFRQDSTRDAAVRNVKETIGRGAPELGRFLGWHGAASKRGVYVGRLVLFASLEDFEGHDTLGRRYRALSDYPEGSPTASLEDAAREVARAAGASS